MQDFNFFYYVAVFLAAFFITVISVKILIPALRSKAKQPIYTEGPKWHMSKQGTPTMGGLGFLISITLALLLSSVILSLNDMDEVAASLSLTALYAALNSFIGIIDDSAKIKKRENEGLLPWQKLLLQTAAASLFLLARRYFFGPYEAVSLFFGSIDLGVFYFPISLIMLVGTTNAANLTDGIDGLASGVAFASAASLAMIYAKNDIGSGIISFSLMGAAVGFLIFNLHPAKIFMGDTGSLYLGSVIAACCINLGNPFLILLIGSVYLFEALSVIIQVTVYKLTKKRVFKMAPFHHHLEKCGWSENKIVIYAILFTVIASCLASFFII